MLARKEVAGLAANSEKTANKKRGAGKPFKKGQSGNPSGRRKEDPEVKEILKVASPEAALRLVKFIKHRNPKIAMAAIVEVLDRTQGKPEAMSKVEITGANGKEIIVSWGTSEKKST